MNRKHVTVRYFQVPLSFDQDEQAHGTTLLALPEDSTVSVIDASQIGGNVIATLAVVSSEPVSQEELDEIQSQIEAEQAEKEAPSPAAPSLEVPSIEQHRANRAQRRAAGKKTPPPTTA